MSRQGTSYITAGIALLVVFGFGWLAYLQVFQSKGPAQMVRPGDAVAVHVTAVHSGSVRELRTFSGTLTPRAQFVIAPKIFGRLERLFVDVGDPVHRGQIVALLDDAEFVQQMEVARAELEVARANLEEARSNLDIAEKEYVRVELLHGQMVTSRAELDLSRSKYLAQQARLKVAEAQVGQRLAALRAAEVRLGFTQLRATWPENGQDLPWVVGERFADEGATLSANAQVFSILDISELRAVFHVTERDYPQLRVGQAADVTLDALPGMVFPGRVSRIAPIFREASRQARVELELANPDNVMKPGMFVKATLELARAEEAVLAPTAALVRRNGSQGVFLVSAEGQKARYLQVRVGIVEGEWAQILEPANPHAHHSIQRFSPGVHSDGRAHRHGPGRGVLV